MRLVLPRKIADTLSVYANATVVEVSGLGKVQAVDADTMLVSEVYLLQQKCSFAKTVLDPSALAAFMDEKVNSGEDVEHVRLWWHSHAAMSVCWSGTDDNTCALLSAQWMVALCINQQDQYIARLEMRRPFNLSTPLKVSVDRELTHVQEAALVQEVKEKVTAFQPKGIGATYSGKPFVRSGASLESEETGIEQGILGPVPKKWRKKYFFTGE